MAHSSLIGTETTAREPAGRDNAALGPGDSSDSGSDVAGTDGTLDDGDPGLPVDIAMRDDAPHSLLALDMLTGNSSDSAGTGERRSAASDAGPEAADIGFDRIDTPGAEGMSADDADEVAFEVEDDGTSEDAPPSHPPKRMKAHRPPSPTTPEHPNPEPDAPAPLPGDDDAEAPNGDRERQPVRAALKRR